MAERGDRVEHREENYRLSWLKGVLKLGVHIIYHLLRDTSGKEKSTINNDTRTAFVNRDHYGQIAVQGYPTQSDPFRTSDTQLPSISLLSWLACLQGRGTHCILPKPLSFASFLFVSPSVAPKVVSLKLPSISPGPRFNTLECHSFISFV